MAWNSVAPDGTKSVKANRPILQDNTTYIQTTMGNSIVGTNTVSTRDHFWNVGSNEDGRHRFIQSPGFTVGGNPTNPVLGTGMGSVLYAKTTNGTAQWFARSAAASPNNIFQVSPNIIKINAKTTPGDKSSYFTISAIPDNVYGEVFAYIPGFLKEKGAARAYFLSTSVTGGPFGNINVMGYSIMTIFQTSGTPSSPFKFGNGSEGGIGVLRARNDDTTTGATWNFIITYRAL